MSKEELASKLAQGKNKIHAENEAKRLENKVKAYNAANNSNSDLTNNSNASSSLNNTNKNNSGANLKDKLQKKAGSAALQSMGVPKGAADKAIDFAQSEKGKKLMNATNPLAMGKSLADKLLSRGEEKNNSEEETSGSFEGSVSTDKIVKYGLLFFAYLSPILIFCVLFISASQVFLNAISLGTADSLNGEEVEDKINKKGDDGLDQELSDEDIAYDIYISDSNSITVKDVKLNNFNVIQIATNSKYLRRKYNEASLDEIEDFFPAVVDSAKNYDENMVYDFFFKMYNLFVTYRDVYNVRLDLPLLMATLNLQSSDKNVVFEANLSPEDRKKTARELPIEEFDYYYDWSKVNYVSDEKTSNHDMELLAKHMVANRIEERCLDVDGNIVNRKESMDYEIEIEKLSCGEDETYETIELGFELDTKRYKEFLREFLEHKYYIDGGYKTSESIDAIGPLEKDGNYVDNVTFTDASFGSIYYFNQTDYKNYYYSKDTSKPQFKRSSGGFATISSHGCGPTSLSIVVSTFLNREISPIETVTKTCQLGGCTATGTKHNTLIDLGKQYGMSVETTKNNQTVIDALSTNNSLVIVLMGPGTFTRGGHYIVLTGVNSNGQVSVADPASRKRTDKKWYPFNTIVEQKKSSPYLIFSR